MLPRELLTVSGVERAPGMAGVKLELSRQSVELSAFVVQLGAPNDHSVEVKARLLLEAGPSPPMK